jgi:uncharacterized membrane protein YccC
MQSQLTDDRPTPPSLVGGFARATLAGVILGSFMLLVYGPRRVGLLLPACAAGVAFTWVIGICGLFVGKRTSWFFSVFFVFAGAVAGLAWSAVSPERVSPALGSAVGAGLAALRFLIGRGGRRERK